MAFTPDVSHVYDDFRWWPTFSDEAHPLDPDETPLAPSEALRQILPSRTRTLQDISSRLKGLYEKEKTESGITYEKWAECCGLKDRRTPPRWIKHPETMDATDVELTCDLFGISLEYLRGEVDDRGTTAEAYDATALSKLYDSLNPRHKKLVSEILKECLMVEVAARLIDDGYQEVMDLTNPIITKR